MGNSNEELAAWLRGEHQQRIERKLAELRPFVTLGVASDTLRAAIEQLEAEHEQVRRTRRRLHSVH